MNKTFGESNRLLGNYLRSTLLICTSTYYSKSAKTAKTYKLNIEGANLILSRLKISASLKQLYRQTNIEKYGEQFHTGEFNYNDQSSRLNHPTHGLTKEDRKDLLEHYKYNWHYDVQCCAPSLIYQSALMYGMNEQPMLKQFLADRNAFRNRFNYLEIDPQVIKEVINALFTGAKLGLNKRFHLYDLIGDRAKIYGLCEDEYLTQLRKEIKKTWQVIKKNTQMGLSSKEKASYYRSKEREVLDATQAFAKRTHNNIYCIHDGWSTQDMLDQYQLIRYIRERTGFVVNIDCESSLRDMQKDNTQLSTSAYAESIQSIYFGDKPLIDTTSQKASPSRNDSHRQEVTTYKETHIKTHSNSGGLLFPYCVPDFSELTIDHPPDLTLPTWLRTHLQQRIQENREEYV